MKSNFKNNKLDANKKVDQKSPHPFLLALILTGILATEAYPNLNETAIAAVKVFQSPQRETKDKIISKTNKFANILKSITETKYYTNTEISQSCLQTNKYYILDVKQVSINKNANDVEKFNKSIYEETEKIANQSKKIPNYIVETVRQDLASQISIAPETIKVLKATQETWPDTCLGLAKNDELCGLRLVEGWRLVLSNCKGKWVYRTDNLGQLIRVESKKKK